MAMGYKWAIVLLFCPGSAVSVEAAEPIRLRILSYNIHHAEGVDRRLDVERIAEVIRSTEPDLVALQEVDDRAQRTQSVDQPAELARRTKMEFAFGANLRLQGGHYGNVVLSRFPIVGKKNHLLPNVGRGEQRGVLEAHIQLPGTATRLLVLATHFDHRTDDRERVASAQLVNDLALKRPSDLAILAGDFNDSLGSSTLTSLTKVWTPANSKPLPTIPVAKPTQQIDFVFYRPSDCWRVREVRVLGDAVASDHRPILAVLELQSSPPQP